MQIVLEEGQTVMWSQYPVTTADSFIDYHSQSRMIQCLIVNIGFPNMQIPVDGIFLEVHASELVREDEVG